MSEQFYQFYNTEILSQNNSTWLDSKLEKKVNQKNKSLEKGKYFLNLKMLKILLGKSKSKKANLNFNKNKVFNFQQIPQLFFRHHSFQLHFNTF
jgi:hypothetical protein